MVQNLLKASQFITSDLSQIYEFFGLLVDCLSLTKSVLLFKHPQTGELLPWHQNGFDPTTLVKLRLSNEDLAFIRNDGEILIQPPANLPLRELFSTRDHDTMDSVLLLPVFFRQQILGVLIIADNPYFSCTSHELEMIFRPIQDILRQIMEKHAALTGTDFLLQIQNEAYLAETDPSVPVHDALCISVAADAMADIICSHFVYCMKSAVVLDIRGCLMHVLQGHIERIVVGPQGFHLLLNQRAQQFAGQIMAMAVSELGRSLGLSKETISATNHVMVQPISAIWIKN